KGHRCPCERVCAAQERGLEGSGRGAVLEKQRAAVGCHGIIRPLQQTAGAVDGTDGTAHVPGGKGRGAGTVEQVKAVGASTTESNDLLGVVHKGACSGGEMKI